MKLENLSSLVSKCETLCDHECCGIYAYDFSPINIANYLTGHKGGIDEGEITLIEEKLNYLISEYSQLAESAETITIEEVNQRFTAKEIVILASEIKYNLEVAGLLVAESESKRFKNSLNDIQRNRYLLKKRHPSAKPEQNS